MPVLTKPFRMALAFAFFTSILLAGSLFLALLAGNFLFAAFTGHMTGLLSGLSALPVVLLVLFGGGALWGLSAAWLTGADPWRLAVTGSLAYGGAVLLVGILLELVFGLLGLLSSLVKLPIHIAFSLVFVPAAGLIASFCAYRLSEGMQRRLQFAACLRVGLAAGAGFLIVNLVMLWLGWQVGAPGAAERSTMLTVMLLSNTGAALAGGGVLGWQLAEQVSVPSAASPEPAV